MATEFGTGVFLWGRKRYFELNVNIIEKNYCYREKTKGLLHLAYFSCLYFIHLKYSTTQ